MVRALSFTRFFVVSPFLLSQSLNFPFRYSVRCQMSKPNSPSLISPTTEGIEYAAKLLQNGQLVSFPTETVYGLGANALDEQAVKSIFIAKSRPLTDPLIVHVPDVTKALEIIDVSPEELNLFIGIGKKFWPGPLTMIVKAASCIPLCVTAGTGYVGIRIPSHPLALKLLHASNIPIAAPSANRFGHVSPTRAEHVLADLESSGVKVLDGEDENNSVCACEYGVESTVLKIDSAGKALRILRHGAVKHLSHERYSYLPLFCPICFTFKGFY